MSALMTAVGDIAEQWNDPRVSKSDAKRFLTGGLIYTPSVETIWDRRLGPFPKKS
jgi:hypothetical protein